MTPRALEENGRKMKAIRFLMVALVVCVIASCSDSAPTAPATVQAPNASLIGDLLRPTGLLQCSALPAASTTQTIGPSGGSLTVGPHVLRIPAAAAAPPAPSPPPPPPPAR